MHNKESLGRLGPSRGLDVRLPRTRVLLLGLFLAVASWLPETATAQMDMDVLGGMVLIEAGGESERDRGRGELEASMHTSLLQDFQEVTEGIPAMDAADSGAIQQNTAAPTAFPDSSAVVGRIFWMKVPNKMEDVCLGDIIKVSLSITIFRLLFPHFSRILIKNHLYRKISFYFKKKSFFFSHFIKIPCADFM